MKNSIQEALYDHFNKRLDGRKGKFVFKGAKRQCLLIITHLTHMIKGGA